MSESFQPNLDFNAVAEVEDREAFVVDLDGYEGPLHVLLALARNQKVDLLKLSITQLAEQYLAFVHEARRRNFALAADYLVMASWLAYLKSRLLLPRTDKGKAEEPPAEEMAAALAEAKIVAPVVPVVANVLARPESDPEVIRRLLVEQVTGRVRWRESMEWMATEGGVTRFVEIGSGKVLTGMAKRIAPDAEALPLNTPEELEAFAKG